MRRRCSLLELNADNNIKIQSSVPYCFSLNDYSLVLMKGSKDNTFEKYPRYLEMMHFRNNCFLDSSYSCIEAPRMRSNKKCRHLHNQLWRIQRTGHRVLSMRHIATLFLIQHIIATIAITEANSSCRNRGLQVPHQTNIPRMNRITFLYNIGHHHHYQNHNHRLFKRHITTSTTFISSSPKKPICIYSPSVAIYSTSTSLTDGTKTGSTINATDVSHNTRNQNDNKFLQVYNRTFSLLPITTQNRQGNETEHNPTNHHNLLSFENIKSLWKWKNNNTNQSFMEVLPPMVDNAESKLHQLSSLLEEHAVYASQWDELELDPDDDRIKSSKRSDRNYGARTIAGLIMALAEEATDLDVKVDANYNTPVWNRTVDSIRIQFSKLGFQPLRMRGSDKKIEQDGGSLLDPATQNNNRPSPSSSLASIPSPDEAFDQIDTDHSGALDVYEVAIALRTAAINDRRDGYIGALSAKSLAILGDLARRLVRLYDSNGDGVVDRGEYKDMVKDMTKLRSDRRAQKLQSNERNNGEVRRSTRLSTLEPIYSWVQGLSTTLYKSLFVKRPASNPTIDYPSLKVMVPDLLKSTTEDVPAKSREVTANDLPKGEIIISDLSLDLRRLLFGAVPIVKKIFPGGPLILDPFNVTVLASFNRDDIMSSNLLDAGLRQLVARALRRRARSWRDFFDGAVFYGRTWTMASVEAPFVEVPRLTNVDFDEDDRLIITGLAKVRASPDQPLMENSFKLRTRIGTRENGQFIRLQDPELALGLECPKDWEVNIKRLFRTLNIYNPVRPKPIDIFFPLVSPIKATDQDGFNLGEDNRINSIFIKDGALHFEVRSTLRPGRFLGNYYIAFVVPNRTFIITIDRVLEGMRVARRNKREQKRAQQLKQQQKTEPQHEQSKTKESPSRSLASSLLQSSTPHIPPEVTGVSRDVVIAKRPNFISRFLEGYMEAAREETDDERSERMARTLSKFFGSSEV